MNFEVRRSVLPYSPCRTCHSTATTMLFCILLLTTTPTFSDFSAISFRPAEAFALLALCLSFLSQERLDASEVATHGANLVRRFELSHRLLNAHPEQLVREIALLDGEVVGAEVAQFRRLHSIFSC